MRSRPRNNLKGGSQLALLLLWVLLALPGALQAQPTILYLKNGDRLTGTILTEDTNRVVLATTWAKELAVPVTQIQRREKVPVETAAPGTAASNVPPALVAQPAPGAPAVTTTNQNGAPNPNAPVAVTTVPSPPRPATTHKRWKAELRLGADFIKGAKDQEIYYGRFKLTYERPYNSNPKEYFRNVLDYTVDYGRTEGVLSANRMDLTDKTDVDIGKRWYVYNLLGVGYDEIRKIDTRFEVGPGFGYHLITHSNLVMNVEAGMDYQAQYRADDTNTKNYYPRLAEDITWKLQKRLTWTEKFEFFPEVDSGDFRFRFESTLSFGFWQKLSLNLTVLDLYDSEPAFDVPKNEAQLRSSLGITF